MGTLDDEWEGEDISDFTEEEQAEIRRGREESRRIFSNPESLPDLDPELVERMWRHICQRMGWAKP